MIARFDAAGSPPDTPPPANAGREPPPDGAPDPRRKVLVVDDEAAVRFLITELLDDLHYTAIEAVDGPSGLDILRSDPVIDLMITDVGLPGSMNGRLLAAAARAERPGLAILFITGYDETAAWGDGPLEPGTKVLTKPFSIDALACHIRELTSSVGSNGRPSE